MTQQKKKKKKKCSKLIIKIIEEVVKIHSKLTIKIQKVELAFIAKLGLISHLVLVYLLLTFNMLLLNNICSIAQFLGFVHIPQETGSILNVHKSYER